MSIEHLFEAYQKQALHKPVDLGLHRSGSDYFCHDRGDIDGKNLAVWMQPYGSTYQKVEKDLIALYDRKPWNHPPLMIAESPAEHQFELMHLPVTHRTGRAELRREDVPPMSFYPNCGEGNNTGSLGFSREETREWLREASSVWTWDTGDDDPERDYARAVKAWESWIQGVNPPNWRDHLEWVTAMTLDLLEAAGRPLTGDESWLGEYWPDLNVNTYRYSSMLMRIPKKLWKATALVADAGVMPPLPMWALWDGSWVCNSSWREVCAGEDPLRFYNYGSVWAKLLCGAGYVATGEGWGGNHKAEITLPAPWVKAYCQTCEKLAQQAGELKKLEYADRAAAILWHTRRVPYMLFDPGKIAYPRRVLLEKVGRKTVVKVMVCHADGSLTEDKKNLLEGVNMRECNDCGELTAELCNCCGVSRCDACREDNGFYRCRCGREICGYAMGACEYCDEPYCDSCGPCCVRCHDCDNTVSPSEACTCHYCGLSLCNQCGYQCDFTGCRRTSCEADKGKMLSCKDCKDAEGEPLRFCGATHLARHRDAVHGEKRKPPTVTEMLNWSTTTWTYVDTSTTTG